MAFSYPSDKADFICKVKSDLTLFVDSSSIDSVLVFPPVNSFCRFLIHQLAQDSFEQLRTFSIGEDPDRRIVVCTKDLVARIDGEKDDPQPGLSFSANSSQLTMVVDDAERSDSSQVRKSRASLPTVGIYRPPAARRLTEVSAKPAISSSADPDIIDTPAKDAVPPARPRVRRPDQQVYVPRAKRAFKDSEKFEDPHASPIENKAASRLNLSQAPDQLASEKSRFVSDFIIDCRKSAKQRSSSPTCAPSSVPPRASQLVETKKKLCQSSSSDLDLDCTDSSIPSEKGKSSTTMSGGQPVNLPPRAEVLVDKKKKLCQSNSLTDEYKWKADEGEDEESRHSDVNSEQSMLSSDSDSKFSRTRSKSKTVMVYDTANTSVIDINVTNTNALTAVEGKCDTVELKDRPHNAHSRNICVVERSSNATEPARDLLYSKVSDSCQNVKSSDVIGESSSDEDYKSNDLRNISDRSSGGSSESLSSSDSVESPFSPVQLIKPVKLDTIKKASPAKATRTFNPDECDWDALLDEDGDVLDPFLMKELTSAVGEVQVNQPKSDYRSYRSQVPADQQRTRRSTADEDLSHVVEIYSFPPEFKTNDLVAVFSPFKNTGGGFEIKWVDDTHALGVFASTLVAEQVLAYHHPMVRTRPMTDATLESRLKARRLSESIQSFRPRPETCAALARRLVTGALGVKLATARQEREEEKRVLKEAREKRRLAAQQRDDIWNSG